MPPPPHPPLDLDFLPDVDKEVAYEFLEVLRLNICFIVHIDLFIGLIDRSRCQLGTLVQFLFE